MLCFILIYLFAKSQNIWAYLAWGFTKLYLALRLETTFIRKKRLNIIKQSYILFFPQMSPNVFFSHVKTFPGTFLCVGVSNKMTI